MEIEAGGEFDQIELETGMGIRGMKVTRFTEEERQLSWVVMGTTPVLKERGYKNGYNRPIFVIPRPASSL
jgi:hypothetical protein